MTSGGIVSFGWLVGRLIVSSMLIFVDVELLLCGRLSRCIVGEWVFCDANSAASDLLRDMEWGF